MTAQAAVVLLTTAVLLAALAWRACRPHAPVAHDAPERPSPRRGADLSAIRQVDEVADRLERLVQDLERGSPPHAR